MMLAGWSTRDMLRCYGRATATDQALAAYRRLSLGYAL